MDYGVRNELPKPGQDTRYLVDYQRQKVDEIRKETEEYEQRSNYLKNKIREIENKIFVSPIGTKIKELVKENLNLSIDVQCLSIELDILNQGVERAVPDNSSFVNRGSPMHYPGSQQMSPMNHMSRGNTPTSSQQSNVVTLDTSSYPYAQVIPSSPYPVQPMGYPPQMNGRTHLSPHHEPARQMSMNAHHPGFYSYDRQGSLSILNQVPPPAGGWPNFQMNQMGSIGPMPSMSPMTPTMIPPPGQVPPVPPRPSDLPLRGRPVRNLPTPPHRPVPPPPTPPKPTRSPNLERPRSSNDMLDPHADDDENLMWECSHCTFQNHSAIQACEMCNNARVGSVATINRSPH